MQRGSQSVLRPANLGRPAVSGKGGAASRRGLPPLAPVPEESAVPSPPDESLAGGHAGHDLPPISKFNDWQAVKGLPRFAHQQAQHPTAAQEAHSAAATARLPPSASGSAADVARLVHSLLQQASGTERAPPSTAIDAGLEGSLTAVADAAVLSLATDSVLAELLTGLQPLLCYSSITRQWATPGLAALLSPLQHSCQERLLRTSLPCDGVLAGAAARFFTRVIREAGGLAVGPSLLDATATYTQGNCRLLSGGVLASLLTLLATARHQPAAPATFGGHCVARLLHLQQGSAGLALCSFASVAEALAQLRCINATSAHSLVSLAVNTAHKLEAGQQLVLSQLLLLARIMQSIAICAATTPVPSPTLLAATAAWHLLTVRAESMADRQQHQQAQQAQPDTESMAARAADGSQHLGLALSRMWCASRLLMAVTKASPVPSYQLPDRLGLASHSAWLDRDHRACSSGLSSAQRRVLAALDALKVRPSQVTTNKEVCEGLFHISVAVRIKVQSNDETRRTAILIRDLRHLMSNSGPSGPAPLGFQAAQESLLKAAGWHVVCLDSPTCLSLPVSLLADELGALMMGDTAGSSLRFAA